MTVKEKTVEKRTFNIEGFKVRSSEVGDQESFVAEGYAAVFDSPTDIDGWYEETIAPGAFTNSLTERDVRCLFNHNWDYVLGRVSANTVTLTQDERGLKFEVNIPDTSYGRDLKESMKRGDITQCSFGFFVTKQEEDYSDEIPKIRILEVDLWEISIVTLPAYEDTTVSLRSKSIITDIEKRNELINKIQGVLGK